MPRVITNKTAQGPAPIYGTGALIPTYDPRDYQWSEIAHGSAPFNWVTGFDIEEKVGKITPKNQNGSGSCGGQAWSMYSALLEALATGTFEERSAKFIYAQTAVPGGGSDGRTNSELCRKKGVCIEPLCPSYENGNPPSESFMTRKEDITPKAIENAKKNKERSYAFVNSDIDEIAQAVEQNGGCIIGISGENNGTWLTPFPKPPLNEAWRHWVYVGKAKIINGKKMLGFINSWGENCGEQGWQWVGEDYFQALRGLAIWLGITMVYDATETLKPHYKFTKLLRFGMTDLDVKKLQEVLKYEGLFPSIPTTNYFGKITRDSVKKFQQKHSLQSDGIVGKYTREELNATYS
jgi:hypothetical protein